MLDIQVTSDIARVRWLVINARTLITIDIDINIDLRLTEWIVIWIAVDWLSVYC